MFLLRRRASSKRFLLFLAVGLFLGTRAYGLVTAYVTFEHPEGWRCELSQGVWICQSTQEPGRRESVVLSIATMRTEWDTLDNYLQYLKQPRPIQDEEGKTITPTVTYARKRQINGVSWVDSLQKDSELPGFWTRYVATVQDKLAILITYIVSEEYYQKLAPQFEKMVSSLKPNAEFNLNISSEQWEAPLPGTDILGKKKEILQNRLNLEKKKEITKKEIIPRQDMGLIYKLIAIVGIAAIAVMLLRLRRRRKASQPSEPSVQQPGANVQKR